MAFIGLNTERVDVARRTDDGRKAIAFPATGLPEISVRPAGCAACPRLTQHDICERIAIAIPHGETRYQRIAEAERPTVDDLNALQAICWLTGYFSFGYIGSVPFNAGEAGDNATDEARYEIIAASGTTLTLKGRNPKCIVLRTSALNPEWPGAAPDTLRPVGISDVEWDAQKYGAVIFGTRAVCVPAGASVEFAHPSNYFGKLRPHVVSITPPAGTDLDDVTFTVETSIDISNAKTPIDLFYPPADGKYYCLLRFEALHPQRWLNLQSLFESQFTQRTVILATAEEHELLDSAGASTRVLYPAMMAGALTVSLSLQVGGAPVVLSDSTVTGLLATTQSGAAWSTVLDLSSIDFATTYGAATVVYHPEAIASDAYRIPFASSCYNSQADPTGSYVHSGGRMCTASASADQFATYGAHCWQPDCSHFALGETGSGDDGGPAAFGNHVNKPDDVGDEDFWSALWHRAMWYLEQEIPGLSTSRNFKLVQPGNAGPSLQALAGGWIDSMPVGGYYPSHDPWFPARWGKRITWTDEDDNERQRIVSGAFYLRAYDYTAEDGPSDEWTAGTTPTEGCVANAVAGWTTQPNALGGARATALARLPFRDTGGTNVYSYQHGSSGMAVANERHASSEAFLTALDLAAAEDSAVADPIRARFS